MGMSLSTEVRMIKGVGPQRAQLLAERGIYTLEDLLGYLPFRYEDRIHLDRKSTRLNSSHSQISYAVFCLKKKINEHGRAPPMAPRRDPWAGNHVHHLTRSRTQWMPTRLPASTTHPPVKTISRATRAHSSS